MKQPRWLVPEVIRELHNESLRLFGGRDGMRDEAMFARARVRPEQIWHHRGKQATVRDLAAAYAFGLVKKHSFLDGKKRIAFLATTTFLEVNGSTVSSAEAEAVIKTLALAAGELDEAGFAAWLGTCFRPGS